MDSSENRSDLAVSRLLLARPLDRQRLLQSALFSRLQVEGMLLRLANDVFLLNLALEAPKSALKRFAVLYNDNCQEYQPLSTCISSESESLTD